ncbi:MULTISPECIES: TadG family pilus assembly protein [Pseudonocardia]|jgi:hypothetical protein|uniref:Flp pilus-assembly TadE/G-like n=2 Tax=Pseudonocardia TaxID=1847 RepID=A0A7G7MBN1_9PSEU|nr:MULTISPECIES: TadG family pilus assembly protein [Pseudonocardia]MBW0116280.1 hypothetical protein [Pseudonocardia abyssalis]MBW0135102.1 hypothetical protein [Pseudonocardia abyssalis]QNG50192.1 hypothetical protein H6H00_18230 [Pseudonocardia petroleophila]
MTRTEDERDRGGGSVSAPMAIAMLALIAVSGLAIDGARKAQQIATADATAEEAARAGGQVVDLAAVQRGEAALDPNNARAAAQEYLEAAGVTGEVFLVAPDRIRVEVVLRQPTVLLGLVGVDEISATGSAEADVVPSQPGPAGG